LLRVVHHPDYEFDIGAHVFPTRKYRLVRERLLANHILTTDDIIAPHPVSNDDVLLVHTTDWVHKITTSSLSQSEQQTLEVPFSPSLRDAMWLCAGGTLLTAALAMEHAVAVHLGGGFHHAFPDHGEGFCLINDVAIATRMLMRDDLIDRALIIDLDVHHGNGTAAIFADTADVYTFSMHQRHNYPGWKPPSNRDVDLEDGIEDEKYLELLDTHLHEILKSHDPQIAFYLAGADPYREDQLGGLGLTIEGLRNRDEIVYDYLRAAGVPVAATLAGGYAVNTDDTVEIHCNTVRKAKEVYLRPTETMKRL